MSLKMIEGIHEALASQGSRGDKAKRIAELVRKSGNYRWAGIYDVTPVEISVIGWCGPGAPAYPNFPATQGLCGAAVASGRTVIVGDVAKDARYLTTLGNTRSEMIVPVRDSATRNICGLIDVESECVDAFTDADRAHMEECASALAALWQS